MSCSWAVKECLSLQEMASTRRAAPRCEPTSITFMSSTISRLCLNCHTDWSLGPKGQLRLCQPDYPIASEQSLTVSSLSQDCIGTHRRDRHRLNAEICAGIHNGPQGLKTGPATIIQQLSFTASNSTKTSDAVLAWEHTSSRSSHQCDWVCRS